MSRLHSTWVNECFSLPPKEFMTSLYLLTLHPENNDTDQLNIRHDHTVSALKLSDLSLIFCLHLKQHSGMLLHGGLADSTAWPTSHFGCNLTVKINQAFLNPSFSVTRADTALLLSHNQHYLEIHLRALWRNGCIKDGTTSAKQCGMIRGFLNATDQIKSERKDPAESPIELFFLSWMTQKHLLFSENVTR